MKMSDFIDWIKSRAIEWHLVDDGEISDENDQCPIWAVYESSESHRDGKREPEDVFDAGRRLGLNDRQIARFIAAADNTPTCDKRLRRSLLLATVERATAGGC